MAFIVRHKRVFTALYLIIIVAWFLAGFCIPFEGKDYEINVFTESFGVLLSIGVTLLFVDRLNQQITVRSDEVRSYREEDRLQHRLVREAGSRSNVNALSAIDELRERKWLTGESGLLKGQQLNGADMENANLRDANLQEVHLVAANLKGADLIRGETGLVRSIWSQLKRSETAGCGL